MSARGSPSPPRPPVVVDCGAHRRRLLDLCARLSAGARDDNEAFLRRAQRAAKELPAALRRTLDGFAAAGNREGYLLLRGLPAACGHGAEACLALIASRLGDLVGYLQEKNGALFHDVAPDRSQERQQSAAGSKVPLALHTERCFHPYLPSHVMLLCLRPDPGRRGLTEVASARRILRLLPPRHVPTLFQPVFRTGIDYSFGNTATEKANGPVLAVLQGDPGDPRLRYDLDLMAGLTPRARAALAAVRRAAMRARRRIPLAAGDLLIIDNDRAVHGRAAFTPRYDGRDRLLKRAYLVRDLDAIREDRRPGDRVIRTRF